MCVFPSAIESGPYFRRCQIPYPGEGLGGGGGSNCAAKDTPLAISLKFNFSVFFLGFCRHGNHIFNNKTVSSFCCYSGTSIAKIYILDFVSYFYNQPCDCCIVFQHGKIKQSSRCWSASVVKCRGFFSPWSSSSSSETTFTAWLALEVWYNLFNSFFSSSMSPVYQVGIYFTSRCCQIIIKGNKILIVISSSSRS